MEGRFKINANSTIYDDEGDGSIVSEYKIWPNEALNASYEPPHSIYI